MGKLASHIAAGLDPVVLARRVGMEPDEWQSEALRSEDDRLCLNIHRQGGKSTVAALKALHCATYRPGSLVLIVSPTQRQSAELFRKVLTYYRAIGRPVNPEAENALSLALENGSRVISVPGQEANIRGYSVDLAIVDEAARVPDELWSAITPMLAVTHGKVVAMSTPWGRRGWWHAASGSCQWRTLTVPATDCPRITPEWLEEERNSIGDFWFRQEYLCEFIDPAGQMFSSDDIKAIFAGLGGALEQPPPLTREPIIPPNPSFAEVSYLSEARMRRREAAARREERWRLACKHQFGPEMGDGTHPCTLGCGTVYEEIGG